MGNKGRYTVDGCTGANNENSTQFRAPGIKLSNGNKPVKLLENENLIRHR